MQPTTAARRTEIGLVLLVVADGLQLEPVVPLILI
jgi:hypothetical protein